MNILSQPPSLAPMVAAARDHRFKSSAPGGEEAWELACPTHMLHISATQAELGAEPVPEGQGDSPRKMAATHLVSPQWQKLILSSPSWLLLHCSRLLCTLAWQSPFFVLPREMGVNRSMLSVTQGFRRS